MSTLDKAVRKDGHLIIATFAIDGPLKCSGLETVRYDAQKMTAELGDSFLLLDEKNEIHLTPANKEQNFSYFHFQKK